MSNSSKIKSLLFLICFIVSAVLYNSISKEKEKIAEKQISKLQNDTSKKDKENSITTIHFE